MTTGYVYKLCCTDITVTEIYVGSTKSLRNRKSDHKSRCNIETNKYFNLPVYQYIRTHGGWDNWTMVMIDTMTYNEKIELKKRERKWIEDLHATLNVTIPTRTFDEWYDVNKERISEYGKQYYLQNVDRVKHRHKEYDASHVDQIKQRKRLYAMEHKDQMSEHNRQYRELNYEIITQKRGETVLCECGCSVTRGHLGKHKKTPKHLALLAAKTIPATDIVPDSEPVEDATKNATQTL